MMTYSGATGIAIHRFAKQATHPMANFGNSEAHGCSWYRKALRFAAIAAFPLAGHASDVVDWLTYTAGADRTHYSLVDDSGAPLVKASIQLTSGVMAPLSPAAGSLLGDYWVNSPGYLDSTLGTTTISTSKVQVAPQAGAVQYQLLLNGADLSGMILSVGQLFGSATSGTHQMFITATTASAATVPLTFLGTDAWSDGIRLYLQPLSWDPVLGELSLTSSSSGESAFAFFTIPDTDEPITQITVAVPNGYHSGTGDAIEYAVGKPEVVPEPNATFLTLVAGTLILCRLPRQRRRTLTR